MNRRMLIVGAAITAAVPLLEALTTVDPYAVTDWHAWAAGIGAASVTQLMVYLTKQIAPTSEEESK